MPPTPDSPDGNQPSLQELGQVSVDENKPPAQFVSNNVPVSNKENVEESPKLMCRALFILKHTNVAYRQIKKAQNFPADTKVYDVVDQLLANVEWPKNQQYVIASVCNKNNEKILNEEMVKDKQEYTVTVSNFQTSAFLKLNDGQVKEVKVNKDSTISAFIEPFFENLASKVIQKYDTDFEAFIDCDPNELVENGAKYQVENKTQIEEIPESIEPVKNVPEVVKSVESVKCVPEVPKIVPEPVKNVSEVVPRIVEPVSKEKFVVAPMYQPIDETQNIKRFPTLNTVQIGALYDVVKENIQINENLCSLANFKNFVVEGRVDPKLCIQFHSDVNSFSSRCKHLGIFGIEKITAFAHLKTGLKDYLETTIQNDICYHAVVLTCIGNTYKLDTNNEALRHRLSRFPFGNVTHLLTSITKGINYVVLMGFPTCAVDKVGPSQLQNTLHSFFNNDKDSSILQRKDIQIDIFSNTFENAKLNASISDVKKLLHTLKNDPYLISHKFTDIFWTLTLLDQFQSDIQLKIPMETSNDLMDRATDLLVNIYQQLNERDVGSEQINEYKRVFGSAEYGKWLGMKKTNEKSLEKLAGQVFELVFRHRKGALSLAEFCRQLDKFNFQCSNKWAPDETNLLNCMKEKIGEVKSVEKLGLEFVGSDMEFLESKVYGELVYILTYRDKGDQDYRTNFEHLLSLPHNSTRLLFDQNLLEHPAIPNDYTCILKFENGRLMDQNVLRSDLFRQRSSVARCPNSSLRRDLSSTGKNSVLEIPCPNQLCKREDCFWLCDRCLKQLHYDYSGYFYCKCGMAPIEDFEYSCKNNKTHGSEYTKYQKDELEVCLGKLRLSDDKVILMLGQTGVGKSTFINSLFNYFTFATLDDAANGELFTVIPSSFTVTHEDDKDKSTQVFVGKESEDESFAAGESATKVPKIYSLNYKSSKLIFIDTPGIGDSDGSGTDKQNMEMILNCIAPYKEIHGICVLMKPNESRLTVEFEYCIGELFAHLHCSVTKNLLFCFTNAHGTSYRPGETKRTLETFFSKLQQSRGIQIELTRDNMFCMDARGFRYLCARNQGVDFEPSQYAANVLAWENSASEIQRLVQCITNIEPHSTTKTITLNDVRRKILSLSKPLAEATKACQYNIDLMETQDKYLQSLTGEEQDLKKHLQIKKFHTKQKELGHPRTVCTGSDCMTVKTDGNNKKVQVFEKICHSRCYLEGVSVEVYPNTDLLRCWAMNGTNNCRVCGCLWSTHLHVTWEVVEEWILIEDETTRNNLNTLEGRRTEIYNQRNKCKKFRDQYEKEKKTIHKIGAELAIFLKQHALITHNDSIIEYLKHEINRADMEASVTLNKTKVDALEDALKEYLEQKKIIEEFAKNEVKSETDETETDKTDNNLNSLLCLEDVPRKLNELCNLPLLGKSIKAMMNAELNGQRKQMEFHQDHFNVQEKRSQTNRKLVGMPDAPIYFNIPTSVPPCHTKFLAQENQPSTKFLIQKNSSPSAKNSNKNLPSIVTQVSKILRWASNVGSKGSSKKRNRH